MGHSSQQEREPNDQGRAGTDQDFAREDQVVELKERRCTQDEP